MSESIEHREYVEKIVKYVKKTIPKEHADRIKADLDGYDTPSLSYGDYIPDVLYFYDNKLVIGEAKTLYDFDREHSKNQYISYMRECVNYPGESLIVIAVPWELFITVKNHFRLLKRKNLDFQRVKVIVLTSADCEAEI